PGRAFGHRQPGQGRVGPGGAEHESDVRAARDRGPDSSSGGSLMRSGGAPARWSKALRRRFGIAAPRVTVHSTLPWYWRWLGIAALFGIAAASAALVYRAGRRVAGVECRRGRPAWSA